MLPASEDNLVHRQSLLPAPAKLQSHYATAPWKDWKQARVSVADGRQRCRCAVLAHLNPHVPHVPGFLITFVLKVCPNAARR